MISKHEKINQKSKVLICILVITNVISFAIVFVLFGEINMLHERLLETSEIVKTLNLKIAEVKFLQKEVLKIDRINRNYILLGMFVGKVVLAKLRLFR
jgi:Tfp pilus assembly protein PilO